MPWNIDLTQLLATVFTVFIVPGAAALIAGKFGVRRALEQAKKERAFDRSVKWHESVIETTSRLTYLSKEFCMYVGDGATFNDTPDELTELGKGILECASKLHAAILNAVLFADKKTVRQLLSAISKVESVVYFAGNIGKPDDDGSEQELYDDLIELEGVIGNIHEALVNSIRKQLGLDKLDWAELELRLEPTSGGRFRTWVVKWFPVAAKFFPSTVPNLHKTSHEDMSVETEKAQ